jgi:hypothetical protein
MPAARIFVSYSMPSRNNVANIENNNFFAWNFMFHIKEGTNPKGIVRLGWRESHFGLRGENNKRMHKIT